MSVEVILRRQVSIAGRVMEAETGRALPGVRVSIVAMPEAFRPVPASGSSASVVRRRTDQTVSRTDGLYWFLNLPEGEYKLAAELPGHTSRFNNATADVTVGRNDTGGVKIGRANFVLSPTRLKGKVTGTSHIAGLAMAEVRVKGSGEYSLTDPDGMYSLSGIEAGKRTILVSAQGYETKPLLVNLEGPGFCQTQDFDLVRKTG